MPNTHDPAIVQPVAIDSVQIKGGAVKIVLIAPVGAAREALDRLVRFNVEEQPCLLTLSALQARLDLELPPRPEVGD